MELIKIFVFLIFISFQISAVFGDENGGGEIDHEIGAGGKLYPIEGKVTLPDSVPHDINWATETRMLFNYGEYVGFLKKDGNFIAHVPTGSYIVEVANKDFLFEPIRIDVNSKGKIRARKLQLLQPSAVQTIQYPLKFRARQPAKYFQQRETWRITDFLFSPMVLMMVVPLLLFMVLPRLVDTSDPEVQREMRESFQMPKYEMPELSEMVSSWFGGGKKPIKGKTTKKLK